MDIRLKRIYEPATSDDCCRILVDRLWPRGISKAQSRVDIWARKIAPSTGLRKWFGHDPTKWPEFKVRYFAELDAARQSVDAMLGCVEMNVVTFVHASRSSLNNAVALKEYLENRYPKMLST